MVDSKKADKIYDLIAHTLAGLEGKMIAIEVDSGDYFVGDNTIAAYNKAHKKHPDKLFVFKRIGAKYAFVVGAAW